MKKLMGFIALIVFIAVAAKAYVVPTFRDIKPASQVMLERQAFGAPVVADDNRIKTTYAGSTSAAAVTLTSFTAQPDVPRNLTITPGGTAADVEACDIVVNGTNFFGRTMTETFSIPNDMSTAVTGNKAFKTVTSIVWPANCEGGSFGGTWIVGVGDKLGIKRCMANAGDWAWSESSGTFSGTRATIAVSATAVESNTADFNETMDGSAQMIGFFVQNFACLP